MTKQRTSFKTIFERERVRRGWTQQYIADQLGIENANTVSRWVRGKNLPKRSLHKDLSKLFEMSLEELGLQKTKSADGSADVTQDELLTKDEDIQGNPLEESVPVDITGEYCELEESVSMSEEPGHPGDDVPAPLEQLLSCQSDDMLALNVSDEIEDVRNALSQQTEEIYQNLPTEEHRKLARVLFLRLILPGTTEQEISRRRASLNEFLSNDVRQSQMMYEVIEIFTLSGLLTKEIQVTKQHDKRIEQNEAIVTIALNYDALLSDWKRLADWIQESRCDTRLQQHINKDAAMWKDHKQRDRLYRGVQLREAQAWAKRTIPNHQESDFLRAALARQLQIRIMRVFMTCVVIVTLFPFVSSLLGYRTFLSSPILPGGWWISPQPGGTFDDFLHLAAYAYPSAPTEPAITYVDFTARWGNTTPWETLCHINSHTSDNVFQCTVNLSDLKAIAGVVRISFNVYDGQGNVHDAPNGVHLITYAPAAKMRASPTKCPWETKTIQT